MMSKLLCIIPFYNEESRFSAILYDKIFVDNTKVNFLLVDDKSEDNTLQILTCLKEKYANVSILSLQSNVGKAEAIRSGILAVDTDKYDFIGYLDADMATPIDEFMRLFDFISKNNSVSIVMGSRIKLIGNKVNRSLKRHYFGRIFATIISQIILKVPVYDTQCGAKIIKAIICKQLFETPFKTRWLFDVELLLRLKNNGYNLQNSVTEIPLNEWAEMGNSKIKFSEILSFPFQLIKIYFHYAK